MTKNHLILFLIVILFISGCNSPKFYTEINSLYFKENLTKKPLKKDINKEILKKINKKLTITNHIIYYYQPDYSLSNNNIKCIIYDVENNIYFYVKGLNIDNIIIDTIPNLPFSNYQQENINLYINGKTEKILNKGENCDYSGVNIYDVIYEINLVEKQKSKFYFKNYFYCTDW